MALANPKITAACVEATDYPDLVRKYAISGVPKTVVNDRVEILGAIPEPAFVRQVLSAQQEPPAAG